MALAYKVHYTLEDYQQWQGDWELIEGMPVAMSPSPTRTHQGINGEIIVELKKTLQGCENCNVYFELDWRISHDTVLRPDCVVVCNETGDFIYKTPELIVEILSPATADKDEHYKFSRYEKEGVKYYIMVDPDALIARIYQLKDRKYQKQGVYRDEIVEFAIQGCTASINFKEVFARYR